MQIRGEYSPPRPSKVTSPAPRMTSRGGIAHVRDIHSARKTGETAYTRCFPNIAGCGTSTQVSSGERQPIWRNSRQMADHRPSRAASPSPRATWPPATAFPQVTGIFVAGSIPGSSTREAALVRTMSPDQFLSHRVAPGCPASSSLLVRLERHARRSIIWRKLH